MPAKEKIGQLSSVFVMFGQVTSDYVKLGQFRSG